MRGSVYVCVRVSAPSTQLRLHTERANTLRIRTDFDEYAYAVWGILLCSALLGVDGCGVFVWMWMIKLFVQSAIAIAKAEYEHHKGSRYIVYGVFVYIQKCVWGDGECRSTVVRVVCS